MINPKFPKEALIAITYRCNSRCRMCNIWKYPSAPEDEIRPSDLMSLPQLTFCNITGGEPFIRDDIEDFIRIMMKKAQRIVISTNGYFMDKIIELCRKHPNIGIRVSIEGLADTNDELRGIKGCFDRGLKTLMELKRMRIKDIGFGMTLSDWNILDLMKIYNLSKDMCLEFATACVHNTYYFHKFDNKITGLNNFNREFNKLINDLLKSFRPKNWFRAYFNYGLLNYIYGNRRLLPCNAGTDVFFIDPYGEVMPCNGLDMSMGNIKKNSFEDIWNSERARQVREAVKICEKNCWMIGTVVPAMKKDLLLPLLWVIKNKIRLVLRKDIKIQICQR